MLARSLLPCTDVGLSRVVEGARARQAAVVREIKFEVAPLTRLPSCGVPHCIRTLVAMEVAEVGIVEHIVALELKRKAAGQATKGVVGGRGRGESFQQLLRDCWGSDAWLRYGTGLGRRWCGLSLSCDSGLGSGQLATSECAGRATLL